MVIFPLAPDQTIAQMWSNGARGGVLRWCLKQLSDDEVLMFEVFRSTLVEQPRRRHDNQIWFSFREHSVETG